MTTIVETTNAQNGNAAGPVHGKASSYQKLSEGMKSTATLPLWEQMKRLNPPAPDPQTIPYIWKYDEIRPLLLQAGELVTEKQAERRVLMLVNPKREAPFTTDTLYAGLQLVMPHETAPAHRHTAFAMRFIIEGSGGFTAVHGCRVPMRRGDVILTPTWNWHDHGNHGGEPMIWLDGLDLPNFAHFPVHFVEHYRNPRYPAEDIDADNSPIIFPWERMKGRLDAAAEGAWVSLPYLKEDGREVSRIIGGSAERLESGKTSPAFRETSSAVYHVIEGAGHSEIGGEKIGWKKGDTFCIPAWNRYQHFASPGETVYLYRFDDKPMLKALGFYRTEEMGEDALISD